MSDAVAGNLPSSLNAWVMMGSPRHCLEAGVCHSGVKQTTLVETSASARWHQQQ